MKSRFARLGRRRKEGETSVSPFFLLVALLLLFACNPAEREAKAELARLEQRVDELREAKNDFKQERLEALQVLPCKHHCELQEICVAAYQVHVQALHHLKEARELVLSSSAHDHRALELLSQAERELKEARPKTQYCTRVQNDALRANGIR